MATVFAWITATGLLIWLVCLIVRMVTNRMIRRTTPTIAQNTLDEMYAHDNSGEQGHGYANTRNAQQQRRGK